MKAFQGHTAYKSDPKSEPLSIVLNGRDANMKQVVLALKDLRTE